MYGAAGSSTESLIDDVEDCAKPQGAGASATIANIVMGASDGSTVPFALAAGLASTTAHSKLVLTGVVAELAAGFIAMGLGGYMAAQAENSYADTQQRRFLNCLRKQPLAVRKRLQAVLSPIGVSESAIDAAHARLCKDEDMYAQFVLANERAKDEEESDDTPAKAAAAVGFSYVIAGALPSIPYLIFPQARRALVVSIVVGVASLLVFGWVKGALLGSDRAHSALQTALLGAFAAATSYALASSVG